MTVKTPFAKPEGVGEAGGRLKPKPDTQTGAFDTIANRLRAGIGANNIPKKTINR